MKKLSFIIFALLAIPVAYAKLSATGFPGTISDMSFTSRVENAAEGYKPFLDQKAYRELNIVPGEEEYTDHMIAQAENKVEQQEHDAATMNISEYCEKHPDDTDKCEQKTSSNKKPSPNVSHSTASSSTSSYEQTPSYYDEASPSYQPIASTTTNYSGYTIGGGQVINNNIVVNGSCYPAAKDAHFTNQILTTGRFEKQFPAFEKGLITVFRKEGGCGTIKNDPCGYTCYGIGSGKKCMGVVVNSRSEAENVYYERFWKKYKIDKLPDVISTDVFIACMASGPGTALSQFRRFLGLKDKKTAVDDEMVNAVKNYKGDIHNAWMDKRDAFLQKIAQERYKGSVARGYKNAIELKRKNGCHVRPSEPLYR